MEPTCAELLDQYFTRMFEWGLGLAPETPQDHPLAKLAQPGAVGVEAKFLFVKEILIPRAPQIAAGSELVFTELGSLLQTQFGAGWPDAFQREFEVSPEARDKFFRYLKLFIDLFLEATDQANHE